MSLTLPMLWQPCRSHFFACLQLSTQRQQFLGPQNHKEGARRIRIRIGRIRIRTVHVSVPYGYPYWWAFYVFSTQAGSVERIPEDPSQIILEDPSQRAPEDPRVSQGIPEDPRRSQRIPKDYFDHFGSFGIIWGPLAGILWD